MRQKDLIMILVIVVFSVGASFLFSKFVFNNPANRQQEVEVVQPITAEFQIPDKRYFNEQAFDPTQPITISQNANSDPFSGSAPGQ